MRKFLYFIMISLMLFFGTACSDIEPVIDSPTVSQPSVDEQIDSHTDELTIDVDLTTLSSTMVFGEVFNMVTYPERYVGKVVKASGLFKTSGDTQPEDPFFAVIITDATECCSQGIQFFPTSEYVFPDDFPADGETVTVVGTIEVVDDEMSPYCVLTNSTLLP